jgi:hypothetical protein
LRDPPITAQAELEVLGDIDTADVMLPRTLLCGSSDRVPRGIWDGKLQEYRVTASLESDMNRKSVFSGTTSKRFIHHGAPSAHIFNLKWKHVASAVRSR